MTERDDALPTQPAATTPAGPAPAAGGPVPAAGGPAPAATPLSQAPGGQHASPQAPQDAHPAGAGQQAPEAAGTGRTQPVAAPRSPYTSVPQAPAGYSFRRAEAGTVPQPAAAPFGGTAGAATSVYGAPASGPSAGMGGFPLAPGSPAAAGADDAGGSRRVHRRGPGWGGVIGATLAAALLASGGTVVGMHYLDGSQAAPVASVQAPTQSGTTRTVSSSGQTPDWEAVTDAVGGSVVSITVATQSGTAVGSGVIYDSAGHVVTNNHVVAGATQIQVTLADGRIYAAELTGTDPATDLAVIALKNAPDDLTVAQFGNSDEVVTGENVMAIGNPLGLSSTVTTGIVSAINRPVVTTQESTSSQGDDSGLGNLPDGLGELLRPQRKSTSQTYTNAIQIDAAINPGNSGGPLFDQTGKVIGITSSIAQVSQDSGSIGLGFAIPGNLAVKVADQLIANGTATHAYLGVTIGDGAAQVGDTVRAGAKVGSVEQGSPAGSAGVRSGDVIVAIDGKPTSQAAALTAFVRQYSAGDTVTLTIVRDGEEQQVQATLAERSDS